MIRINLLGQARPKTPAEDVSRGLLISVGALTAGLVLAMIYVGIVYERAAVALTRTNQDIQSLQQDQLRLQVVEVQVRALQREQADIEHRLMVVRQLQAGRSGGEQLLSAMETSVARTDSLWLTSLKRKGDDLDVEGQAGSINAVANFITALRVSGYFTNVDIAETKEDDGNPQTVTYSFVMSAQVGNATKPAPAIPGKS
jgi:Tfp pilus assembly protein PilN